MPSIMSEVKSVASLVVSEGDLLSQVIGQSCKAGGSDLRGQGLVELGLALLDQNSIL